MIFCAEYRAAYIKAEAERNNNNDNGDSDNSNNRGGPPSGPGSNIYNFDKKGFLLGVCHLIKYIIPQ